MIRKPFLIAFAFCAPVLVLILLWDSVIIASYADEINPGVAPISSRPYGKSYGEWSFQWWQWFSLIPAGSNPGEDTTGQYCSSGQNDTNMWFLTLTFGIDKAERTCTIPAQKSIFVALMSNICDRSEYPELKTRDELLKCAQGFNEGIQRDLSLELDGRQIKSLENYRVSSPLANITYPDHNVFGGAPGRFEGVADGFYVILDPLPVGKHELHIKTLLVNNPKEQYGTTHDVTYHLIVE